MMILYNIPIVVYIIQFTIVNYIILIYIYHSYNIYLTKKKYGIGFE